MKTAFKILGIIVILLCVIGVVYELCFAQEVNVKLLAKLFALLVTYLAALTGVRRKLAVPNNRLYAGAYKNILRTAFCSDKKSYNKLMRAIALYNGDRYNEALKILSALENECVSADDTSAVKMFKALCYEESGQDSEAIETYEELLIYDYTMPQPWSNIGLLYEKCGRREDAVNAFKNAIAYNNNYAEAYVNLGVALLRGGDFGGALENSLKALEISSKLKQAMSCAAIAYAALGDNENADKYCSMYGVNGGDVKVLRESIKNIRGE